MSEPLPDEAMDAAEEPTMPPGSDREPMDPHEFLARMDEVSKAIDRAAELVVNAIDKLADLVLQAEQRKAES